MAKTSGAKDLKPAIEKLIRELEDMKSEAVSLIEVPASPMYQKGRAQREVCEKVIAKLKAIFCNLTIDAAGTQIPVPQVLQ